MTNVAPFVLALLCALMLPPWASIKTSTQYLWLWPWSGPDGLT